MDTPQLYRSRPNHSSCTMAAVRVAQRIPLVVVIGTTGVGKTKLGIELAKKMGGEVVNADALQMYRGLSIATAKATSAEMDGVTHHMMSFLNPTESFTPHEFCARAEPLIEDIYKRGKVPIVVGGTLYYIQSLLWKSLLSTQNDVSGTDSEFLPDLKRDTNALERSPQELWDHLHRIDPVMAERLHVNNVRKVERAIDIFESTGKRQSDLIDEQIAGGGGVGGTSPYNYRLLWLYAEKQVLQDRLEKRVDRMIADGLPAEIRDLQRDLLKGENEGQGTFDWSRGVLQAIGFKEFEEYLSLARDDRELQNGEKVRASLEMGADRLKMHTRRYANRQMKWIRNRLVRRGVHVHLLDTSNVNEWEEHVLKKAMSISEGLASVPDGVNTEEAKRILDETREAALAISGGRAQVSNPLLTWKKHTCDVCNRIIDGDHEWAIHLTTRAHRRNVAKLAKHARAPTQGEEGDTTLPETKKRKNE